MLDSFKLVEIVVVLVLVFIIQFGVFRYLMVYYLGKLANVCDACFTKVY